MWKKSAKSPDFLKKSWFFPGADFIGWLFHPWKSRDFILEVPTFCRLFRKNLEWGSFFNNFFFFFEKIGIFSKNEYFCIFFSFADFLLIFSKNSQLYQVFQLLDPCRFNLDFDFFHIAFLSKFFILLFLEWRLLIML